MTESYINSRGWWYTQLILCLCRGFSPPIYTLGYFGIRKQMFHLHGYILTYELITGAPTGNQPNSASRQLVHISGTLQRLRYWCFNGKSTKLCFQTCGTSNEHLTTTASLYKYIAFGVLPISERPVPKYITTSILFEIVSSLTWRSNATHEM